MTRDPQTYRWARRTEYRDLVQRYGPAEGGWAEWNRPQPGAYNIGSTPKLMQKDAEIDYGRSKYRRAHSSKREQTRRHTKLLIKMAFATPDHPPEGYGENAL